MKINCKVCNCQHNCDTICTADEVKIGGEQACCCNQTECDTFCCK